MNRVGAVLISDRFALIAGLSFVAVAECAVGIGWRAVMDRSFKHGVLGREGLAQRHGRQIEQVRSVFLSRPLPKEICYSQKAKW